MARPSAKPGLTDRERHKRFVEMANEVEASEAFDRAFERVTHPLSEMPASDDDN